MTIRTTVINVEYAGKLSPFQFHIEVFNVKHINQLLVITFNSLPSFIVSMATDHSIAMYVMFAWTFNFLGITCAGKGPPTIHVAFALR